jgi:hypothetical protein
MLFARHASASSGRINVTEGDSSRMGPGMAHQPESSHSQRRSSLLGWVASIASKHVAKSCWESGRFKRIKVSSQVRALVSSSD